MKKFHFTLEKYMDVKSTEEDKLKKQMKDIDSQIESIKAVIQDCTKQELSEKEKLNSEYKGGVAANDLHKYSTFFSYLYELRKEKTQELTVVNVKKEECRKDLIKVMNEIKALEKMKERQMEEYKAALALEENKVIDEYVSYQVYSS